MASATCRRLVSSALNPTGNFLLGYPEMNPLNPLSQNFPDPFDHAMSEISHRLTNATCCQLISCHLDVPMSLLTTAGYMPNLTSHSCRIHAQSPSERTNKGDNTASISSSIRETLIFFFSFLFCIGFCVCSVASVVSNSL